MEQFFSNQDQDTEEFQILNMNNLAICYILPDKNILSLFSGKWEFKISKAVEKVWKVYMLSDSLGKPGPDTDPEPHCSWSISLHPSPRYRISGQFVNWGECHCPSKLVHWVTRVVLSVALWLQVSNVVSAEFTHGQNEVLVTPLPILEPKVINPGTVQSLCSQSSTLAGHKACFQLWVEAEWDWVHSKCMQSKLTSLQSTAKYELTPAEDKQIFSGATVVPADCTGK